MLSTSDGSARGASSISQTRSANAGRNSLARRSASAVFPEPPAPVMHRPGSDWASGRSSSNCTIVQADGGTRTAGVSGAYVVLAPVVHEVLKAGKRTDLHASGPTQN